MKDLEHQMYKFFAEYGPQFDNVQMCWKPAIERFVEFCTKAESSELVKGRTPQPKWDTVGKDYIPREGIFYLHGKYRVCIMIQDGYEECGEYDTAEKAREAWVQSQDVLNHNKFTVDEAPPVIRLEPVYRVEVDK